MAGNAFGSQSIICLILFFYGVRRFCGVFSTHWSQESFLEWSEINCSLHTIEFHRGVNFYKRNDWVRICSRSHFSWWRPGLITLIDFGCLFLIFTKQFEKNYTEWGGGWEWREYNGNNNLFEALWCWCPWRL